MRTTSSSGAIWRRGLIFSWRSESPMLDYNANPEHSDALQRAFTENERVVRIQNYRAACILAAVFMPAGVALDLMVYPKKWVLFLCGRLICSALLLFIWWLV